MKQTKNHHTHFKYVLIKTTCNDYYQRVFIVFESHERLTFGLIIIMSAAVALNKKKTIVNVLTGTYAALTNTNTPPETPLRIVCCNFV